MHNSAIPVFKACTIIRAWLALAEDMDQLRRVIKDVLRKRHADLYEILNNPEALKQFSISLYSVEGITKATKNNPEFNALIRDYESGMLFFKTVKQFSQHCLSFITSLQSVGGPAIDAANELKKAWTDEVNRELPDLSASQFLILKSGIMLKQSVCIIHCVPILTFHCI